MKILTISNYFPSHPGGIEIVAQNLVSQWRKNNEVRWMACETLAGENYSNTDNIPLTANNFSEETLGFPYPIPSLKDVFKIIRHVYWSDIVHIHDCLYLPNFIAFITSQIFSKPIVITQHIGPINYKEQYKNFLQIIAYQTIGRLALGKADTVVFINKKVELWFNSKIKIKSSLLIQNGVNHEIFFPLSGSEAQSARIKIGLPKNKKVLLFIGRFTQKKGLHLIKEIANARPNYIFIMLGKGEIDVSQWGMKNIVLFPYQPQEKLREFYIASDLFILPSQGEGFPLAVQESMACGVPAIVSEEIASSLPDAPLISINIFSKSEMLQTLDRVINDPEYLEKIHRLSVDYAKNWDWGNIANSYEIQFTELIANRQLKVSAVLDKK